MEKESQIVSDTLPPSIVDTVPVLPDVRSKSSDALLSASSDTLVTVSDTVIAASDTVVAPVSVPVPSQPEVVTDTTVADSLAKPVAVQLPPWHLPDSIAATVPEEQTHDLYTLVDYFKKHLHNADDQVRAIYRWISRNIGYNVYTDFVSHNEEYSEEKEAMKVLATRKGTCQDYTVLFKRMCEECGIEVQLIRGYNKVGKYLLPDPHQWCVAHLGDRWELFDPTWGAGYVENYTFVPAPNDRYFKVSPDTLQVTHMPFDPLWQMRDKPLSYKEFDTGMKDSLYNAPYFAWADTLAQYLSQSPLSRLKHIFSRMKAYTDNNALVRNELLFLDANMRVAHLQKLVSTYNEAIQLQAAAADSINKFIRYRNATFEPLLPDSAIHEMVAVPERIIQQADSTINTLREVPENYRGKVLELRAVIIELATRIYKERLFLQQYFNTPRMKRKELFML